MIVHNILKLKKKNSLTKISKINPAHISIQFLINWNELDWNNINE